MNIFKRFISERAPTTEERAEALAFKNKLKYGEDVNSMYQDARLSIHDGIKQQKHVKEKLEEIFKFKKRTTRDNWTSFRISTYNKCQESPIGDCLYISYYGDLSPEKDDPIYCMCCKKKLF